MKAGVALNPATPLYLIEDILSEVDIVLIMTVNPGFGGQKFIHNCLNKIKTLRSKIVKNHLNVDIEVDGGINAQTSLEVIKAGANILVAGVAIFHEKDIVKAIQNIRHSI